ncbi:MAG: FtsX-like permease family protein [Chloroflexota bacterium]|nr:MAG: FtsX-like permease family protein [Chloroflexota bacterium]
MSFWNIFLTALRGVSSNKLRSALTTLGIIIGVASVIAMLALGNGARAAVESRFRFLGADQVQISPEMALDNGELVSAGEILSYEDGLRMPASVPLVNQVDMAVGGTAKIRYGRAANDMSISGVTADALETIASAGEMQPVSWPEGVPLTVDAFLAMGRFFTPAEVLESAEICVIGSKTALDLFGGDNPIGETVWVNRERCQVIGVLSEMESTDPSQRYTRNLNESFFMPVSTVIEMLYQEEPSVSLTAHVTDESRIDEAKAQIAAYLRQRHAIEKNAAGEYVDDFNLTTRKDILGAQQEAAQTFSLLLAAMASVSLVVGGIGIMNVMLVSVTERTREIGVRMAIGASTADITWQFLLEAALISAGGGLLGLVVGILSIPLAAALNQGMALLEPNSIPLALGVALLTGIAFGLYPALRAARLDPIEALRYE